MTEDGPRKVEAKHVGEVPDEWGWEELSDIVEGIQSGTSATQVEIETEIPVSRIETISSGEIDLDAVRYLEGDKSDFTDYRYEVGDIIFSKVNSEDHIGKSAKVREEHNGLYHGTNLFRVRPDSESINSEFLYQYFTAPNQKKIWKRISQPAVNQVSINQSMLKLVRIPVPPVGEQERIASVLYTVDQHVDALAQRHDYLHDLKHALMQDLLTGQTRVTPEERVLPDVVDGGEPATVDEEQVWKEETAGELIESFESGLSYDSDDEVNSPTEDSIPVAGTGAIKDQSVLAEEMAHVENVSDEKRESLALSEGDVLMVAASGSDERLGEAVTVNSDWNALFGTFVTRMRSEKVNSHYLGYYLNSGRVQSKLDGLARGSTSLNNLNKSDLKLMEIHVPPLWEQERIASVLYTVDEMIARTSELRDEYEQLKRALMQDLLSGDVRTSNDLQVHDEVQANS